MPRSKIGLKSLPKQLGLRLSLVHSKAIVKTQNNHTKTNKTNKSLVGGVEGWSTNIAMATCVGTHRDKHPLARSQTRLSKPRTKSQGHIRCASHDL